MSHSADRSQRQYARDEPIGAEKASASSSSGGRRPYQQHSDRRDRSPDRRYGDRHDDKAYPHKARKPGWNERNDSWRTRRDTSPTLNSKDGRAADLAIRGAAKRKGSVSSSHPRDQRRSRSPDLLDRLSTTSKDRRDDPQGAKDRSGAIDRHQDRYGQYAKRPRNNDSESSRRDDRAPKLAPRGRYDENGRRLDSDDEAPKASGSSSYARRQTESESSHRQNPRISAPEPSPEKRIGASVVPSGSRQSAAKHDGPRRSPSPTDRTRSHHVSRDYSPRGSSALGKEPEATHSRQRQWGSAQRNDDRRSQQRADDEAAERRRRRRSPSPARSDTSRSSRTHGRPTDKRSAYERSHQRDRPARWKTEEQGNGWTRKREAEDRWSSRRDDRSRNQDTPPPDRESSSGRLLPRKTEAGRSDRHAPRSSWQKLSRTDQGEQRQQEEHPATPEADTAAVEIPRAGPGEAYVSINQVGEGTYGQVFKARSEQTGVVVALKKIRMESEKEGFPITAMREIKLLQALRHENVVRLHEMMVTRGSIYMVFEYMEHDLNGILAHPGIKFSEAHRKSLALQLLIGLEYLHKKAVLHRDLKGSNILLNNEGRLKLADFGLARFYAKRRTGDYTNRVVTLWYRPPELLFGETQYGLEVDMWGAGCLFLELFVRKPVFQGESEMQQVQVIADILGPMTPTAWPGLERLAWYEMVKPEIKSLKDAASAEAAPDRVEDKDYLSMTFRQHMPTSALQVANGLLTYNPRKRWSSTEALQAAYFSEAPRPELPARILSALDGEWHEYESRRARKKAPAQARVSDRTLTADQS